MGIEYKEDHDLDFIQYCNEEDLKILARYMTHDYKDGMQRFTSELLENNDFKRHVNHPNQYKACWKLVVGELQHFGGDTFANLFRGSGVPYKEILSDVCKKLKVKFEKNDTAYEIENKLLEEIISKSWENLSEEERSELLRKAGVDSMLKGALGLQALLAAIRLGGSASYTVAAASASSMASMFVGSALVVGSLGRMAFLAGPIGIAISTLLTISAISGAAYRVTIPSIIQIAYMRRAQLEQEQF